MEFHGLVDGLESFSKRATRLHQRLRQAPDEVAANLQKERQFAGGYQLCRSILRGGVASSPEGRVFRSNGPHYCEQSADQPPKDRESLPPRRCSRD